MTNNGSVTEWRIIGESVPGASHLRAGIPNQDSILQVRESAKSLPLVLSVSDGHGSNKCFRSDRGSRFAVKKAAQLVGEFLDERRDAFDHAEIESKGKDLLPREFVRRWREAVEADLKSRPFAAEEFDTLEKKDGARGRKLVEANPLLAYGATSLTVAVEESFILYLQLGDGDILTVSAAGDINKPVPEDGRLFANETTSLCSPNAENDFRFHVQKLSGEPPALILLSTDGYVNSFSDEAGFLKVGNDLLEMLRTDGFDFVNENLKGWLEEATRMGSGDDTTLGIICRMNALRKPEAIGAAMSSTVSAATSPVKPADEALAAAGGADKTGDDAAPVMPAPAAPPQTPAQQLQSTTSDKQGA
ncbi:MAG: protein phosphatase 2C domain-containing protein [Acidobacteriota bacterium]|nr:protein phosphatase 2C domain-containing protein [Acidobacteriota bacterium]